MRPAITILTLACVSINQGRSVRKRSVETSEHSLEHRLREIIEHFKKDDYLGIPGIPIPDPMPVPDFQGRFSGVSLKFTQAKVFKLSEFRTDYVSIDFTELKTAVGLLIPQLFIMGTYEMKSFFSRTSGNFTVRLQNVNTEGRTFLRVDPSGFLQVERVDLDMRFEQINMNFDNLGFFGSMFQGIINTVGPFVFNSVKPTLLGEINTIAQTEINAQLKEVPLKFSDDAPPIDEAISKAREVLRDKQLDPFKIPDQKVSGAIFSISTTQGMVEGLSSLHRIGNVTLEMRHDIISTYVNFGTRKLDGALDYNATFFLWPFNGHLLFRVEYVKVAARVSQPINLDLPLRVDDIDLEVGEITLLPKGDNALDRFLKFTVTALTKTLKDLIVCIAEEPIREVLEMSLNGLDIEDLIYQNLQKDAGV